MLQETAPDASQESGVSVVIPCYKAAAYIAETLQSVLAQTVPAREIILVNDGSPDTDEFERILAPFRDRIVYLRQENQGASAARNTGIRAATQPLIAFIDSDDLWEPDYIEVQSRYLQEHPDVAAVFPNGRRFGKTPDHGLNILDPNENGPVTFERMVRIEIIVNTSLMARKEALFSAGLYDPEIPVCEDFDLWLRMVKKGYKIGYHHKLLMHSRVRPGSLSSDAVRMFSNFLIVLEKCRRTMSLSDIELAAIAHQERDYTAQKHLWEGKGEFFAGNPSAAVEHLFLANEYFNSAKLKAAIVLLKTVPNLTLKLYHLRTKVWLWSHARAS